LGAPFIFSEGNQGRSDEKEVNKEESFGKSALELLSGLTIRLQTHTTHREGANPKERNPALVEAPSEGPYKKEKNGGILGSRNREEERTRTLEGLIYEMLGKGGVGVEENYSNLVSRQKGSGENLEQLYSSVSRVPQNKGGGGYKK